jgi:hypothetical protein
VTSDKLRKAAEKHKPRTQCENRFWDLRSTRSARF